MSAIQMASSWTFQRGKPCPKLPYDIMLEGSAATYELVYQDISNHEDSLVSPVFLGFGMFQGIFSTCVLSDAPDPGLIMSVAEVALIPVSLGFRSVVKLIYSNHLFDYLNRMYISLVSIAIEYTAGKIISISEQKHMITGVICTGLNPNRLR